MLDFQYPTINIPRGTSLALGLGCGTGQHRKMTGDLGYQWIGVDVNMSHGDARLLEADARVDPDKRTMIYHGFDPQSFRKLPTEGDVQKTLSLARELDAF